jgi:chitin synthase
MRADLVSRFLAALSFGATKMAPSDAEKFVIMQLPCYTEGEDGLRKSIESLAATKYDDKRKLLCIICDGNITGAGNELPTPQIVLNILGSDPWASSS